jgi:hypothetical protein
MYNNKYGLTFGSDPEIFAAYRGEYTVKPGGGHNMQLPFVAIPAYVEDTTDLKSVGGTEKHPVYIDHPVYKVIGDGAAYEINLKGPCFSPNEVWDKISMASSSLKERLNSNNLDLYERPVINFDYQRLWTEESMSNKRMAMSMIFGCDPDLDACNVDWLCKIEDVSRHPFRYGGGHLHFGGDTIREFLRNAPLILVRMMAIFLGNYGIAVSPFNDLERMRAKYYGRPARFRIQPDGKKFAEDSWLEYRTLANSWMTFPKDSYLFMFDLVNEVLAMMSDPKKGKEVLNKYMDPTITAITNADKNGSVEILQSLGVM